jgi:alanyl-tRNA synthetase
MFSLKKKYIQFFKEKGHQEVYSAPLVPENDPTVLFTTAGMHPLVPFLLGQQHPLGKRLVGIQKCLRTGDIDEVGDKVHHTFFFMLGNWSLGDYFKEEAIGYSFEFLTQVLKFPVSHLAVSCFKGDNDASKDEVSYNKWLSLGIPAERIVFLTKKDNWWGPAGETGPCGPDTEMFYWTGVGEPPKQFDPENSDWVEIWNDVFMEYNKTIDNDYITLEQKNVDTGMGLERVSSILRGLDDNYLSPLFKPMIERLEQLSGKSYQDEQVAMRIVADHLRSAVFVINDDVEPSNVDQGYVLRRLIRRAVRYLKLLNIDFKSVNELADLYINIYKEEFEFNKSFILAQLDKEVEKFSLTLEKGLNKFKRLAENGQINAQEAFLLYQSYGFPIEMTEELAKEQNIEVDVNGFNVEYEKHQEKSRLGAEQKFKGGLSDASEETTKLHTATHLLNEALKKVLKQDIEQRGSNITPKRLRFDFNFDRKLTSEELQQIEDEVNNQIVQKLDVVREEMTLEEAYKKGAHGIFNAKYPEIVSVYSVGDYSKEICMGPHVDNISVLGKFKIIKEESSSGGVRRIKAILED